ncbi:DNA-binding transcriptional regulator, MerR family [Fulvimarina manganoxydans]|uniref:DNA-binding transcriptional regulator, MerR family n=2 Tax=Fulvimarina manganoxydans TaxID=937218 RepID=A0A1W2E5F6_9HYPH|nr:DNA-binding transcriptional regulator, MerR family [Fulvimarina manganoxydans]
MNTVAMHDFYTITELTKEFGISTRTIRFYEDEGLIHPLRRGRTRLFRQSDRQILRNILRGKRLGFSIAEIREIIGMYKTPPGEAGQLKTIIGKVKRRREELEQKRHDIDDLLVELDQAEEACLTRLAELGIDQSRRA